MNSIDSISSSRGSELANHIEEVKSLDEMMGKSMVEINLGFLILYEEWKQKILLSDGISEDENVEW